MIVSNLIPFTLGVAVIGVLTVSVESGLYGGEEISLEQFRDNHQKYHAIAGEYDSSVNAGHFGYGGGGVALEALLRQPAEVPCGCRRIWVEVKHPTIVSSREDHKHHHTLVEDKCIQRQMLKARIYKLSSE
ncbi:hypothetical protein BIW11_03444 [Tropilaelaps mercedesae]|uniref:Uncharacterized protein n=1 Tax=Tropilaelaps mercedesae TaxID=418985 RepID=A0A1V9XL78_9ACAR|nr:hypothetical protein BIW11_03444 [Tropilaelaps mercedesae]